jgi:hypothetical protein
MLPTAIEIARSLIRFGSENRVKRAGKRSFLVYTEAGVVMALAVLARSWQRDLAHGCVVLFWNLLFC